ncbi:AAA family ATPase [Streptomyces sp. Ru87]|uniref:AAA family ATPase n=1 Tax=Streptomyces sp. Ru87 TaxID=2044307 RepID=UPI000BF39B7D|nr:SMC family ATPase [Streptomyces sp. Ru87]PGH51680.1 ATP-binding cassette family protein [Streptomyces sp. Ru87]
MRLHRLRVTAFGPFAGTEEADFDALSAAGLFLLHGPTGAGKTSVLDAVCYALYGGVPGARHGSVPALRSDHADPLTPTEVRLEFTVAGRRLEVTRRPEQLRPKKRGTGHTRDKAQSWLRERGPDGWRALSRSHQEIGEEIGQLLGMSKDQFCQVVLLPQGDFSRFLRAGAEERGKLLGRLFDTRRFAAVEERLAELRRTAEKQVTGADGELLALAHRMAQAAGDTGSDGLPLPGAAPGEPGLAAAVLEWAAVARAGARERRDIAAAAARAAEDAYAAARREHESVAELARRQRRHADALARSAALEEAGPERERIRARLDRARAASRVVDALELREETGRAHRAACERERRARGRLPSGAAGEGAARLAELAGEYRERLGGLAAARRAEQRAAEIAAERAALDREAGTDEDVLAETADWLGRWDSVRAEHQRRIEEAQEAATRAESLAGRIEPAERRLRAAERRDDLTGRLGTARGHLLRAREQAAEAKRRWLELKERRLLGIAAELAAGLTPGEPCAVCGSAEHPRPARAEADHVDRAAEEAAHDAHQRAETAREEAERHLQSLRDALETAGAEAGEEPADRLRELAAELRHAHAGARATAAGALDARAALEHAEQEHARRLEGRRDAERRAAARASRRDALDQELHGIEAGLAQARGGAATVAERAGQLERRAAVLAEAAEAVRDAEAAAERLKEADARLADAAYRAGFDTPGDAAGAVLPDSGWRELQHRLDRWQAESAAVAAELADPDVAAAAARPPADAEAARAALERATGRLRASSAAQAGADGRCAELDRLSARAAEGARRLAPLREEYERIARLAGLAAGTSAENERRMRLESYVLAARLEQVAAAANTRLRKMSAGRYTLVHSDARTSGRGRSGLGLHVVDAWTGSERDTATLSGGETFFASLALALGLADVVTDEAGGTRLDTLFIDEGFGSLDEQTLDEVLDVLDSLRERDRAVGIVSHVPDLRRRIPVQLEVVKERTGSAVRHRSPGAGG